MTPPGRAFFYVAAVLQFLLASGCLCCFGVFLMGGSMNVELGLSPALQMPFIATFALGVCLFTYGGIRTWRRGSRWWWPLLAAVVGIPLVFLLLFVAGPS
jgi:hypothetical protein